MKEVQEEILSWDTSAKRIWDGAHANVAACEGKLSRKLEFQVSKHGKINK